MEMATLVNILRLALDVIKFVREILKEIKDQKHPKDE